jgi:hypothetical protein
MRCSCCRKCSQSHVASLAKRRCRAASGAAHREDGLLWPVLGNEPRCPASDREHHDQGCLQLGSRAHSSSGQRLSLLAAAAAAAAAPAAAEKKGSVVSWRCNPLVVNISKISRFVHHFVTSLSSLRVPNQLANKLQVRNQVHQQRPAGKATRFLQALV